MKIKEDQEARIEYQEHQITALQEKVAELTLELTLAKIKVIDPIFLQPIKN